jgi:Mn2+/Fe2+ NRAMP family transporter
MKIQTTFAKAFGPGIIMALAATGTSHLVQSTRAGAGFGFSLLIFIILANVFKYPFIEYGTRYASSTGKSILEGYLNKGKGILLIYLMVNVATMFTVNGAVTFVTAGILSNLLNVSVPQGWLMAIIFALSFIVLAIGRYKWLDKLLKIVGIGLAISTITAVVIAIQHGPVANVPLRSPINMADGTTVLFIVALMGWMPTAIELSPWNSLWTIERIKETGYHPSLKQSLLDFNIGYWSSALLAVLFMILGAYVLFGSGLLFEETSVGFTAQLIAIYTHTLGGWSYWIIGAAALSTMYSTSITVLDGFSRSSAAAVKILLPNRVKNEHQLFMGMMLIVITGSWMLTNLFTWKFSALIDFATSVSFLAAPIMALINYFVITDADFPANDQPKKWMKLLSWAGIIYLGLFSLAYLGIMIMR